MLRNLAAGTPGMTFLSGCSVRKLIKHDGAICGLELEGAHPGSLTATVVVGADGRNSEIAKLAGVKASSSENNRFAANRAYRNVGLRRGACSQMWLRGGEAGFVFPNDDGVTVIAYMVTKDKLDEFRSDPGQALERSIASLPDCPDLAAAEPLGPPGLRGETAGHFRLADHDA